MADGSGRRLVYAIEDVPGDLNSPNDTKELRTITGSGLVNERTAITSNELRSDRQVVFSKLGNNAPSLSVPIEFSYESYDDLIAAALGGDWVGGKTATIDIDVSIGGVFTRNDGGSWLEDGYTIGTFVTVEGLTVTAEDGAYEVTAVTGTTLTVQEIPASGAATFTSETGADIIFTSGAYGIEISASVTDTIIISATNKTITLAGVNTWNFQVEVGDRLYFQDFSSGGNNGWKEVTGKSDTILTFANDTLTNETVNTTTTITYSTAAGIVKVGTVLKTLTVEEQFTDVPTYVHTKGAKIDTWDFSLQPEAIVTGNFALQGVTYSGYSAVSAANSVATANVNAAFDSFTGFMNIGGIAACIISGFDFSLANGLSRDYALLQQDACKIGQGRSIATASISGFFNDTAVVDLYDDETIFEGVINLQDIDGNGYTFVFPRMKMNAHSLDIPENSITFSGGVDILGGDALGRTNVTIHRVPFII